MASFKALLFIANFAAPSIVKSSVQTCVLKLMGHMVTVAGEKGCGVFMCPAFSYKSGGLFQEEFALLRSLSSAGCNVDNMFQVMFDAKSKSDS